MAIAKRPKPAVPPMAIDDKERQIEAFINGRDSGPTAVPAEDVRRTRVMMRFDPVLLQRIDAAARRIGVSRTAWLHMAASRALDDGDG